MTTARFRFSDALRVAAGGLTARRGRTALSTLGIAIGIAALVGVLGLSESSRADLMAQLDRLGTNMLTVAAGQSTFGGEAVLPESAVAMITAIDTVEQSAAVYGLDETARRTDLIPESNTGGISVNAAGATLLTALGADLVAGAWLSAPQEELPAVVLGWKAAQRLGIPDVEGARSIWVAGRWFVVVGILAPVTLAPEIDEGVYMGLPMAEAVANRRVPASTIYVRAAEESVDDTRSVLARTANPEAPNEVDVSRPSDALEAKAAAQSSLTSLLLALGCVVLLVGAIGVANVMVISVLERRREIGVRRALGATRGAVTRQFFLEAVLLSTTGGILGIALGSAATIAFSGWRGWMPVLPPPLLGAAFVVSLVVGAVAGIYPANRASKVPPTEALRSA